MTINNIFKQVHSLWLRISSWLFVQCLPVPSSVLQVTYQNISSTSIQVNWIPPLNPNGQITHYTVYGLKLHNKQPLHWMSNTTNILITGNCSYAITVQYLVYCLLTVINFFFSLFTTCKIWRSTLVISSVLPHLQLLERVLSLRKMTFLSSP